MAQQAVEQPLLAEGTRVEVGGVEYIVGETRMPRWGLAALPVGSSVWDGDDDRDSWYVKVDDRGEYGGWRHHYDDGVDDEVQEYLTDEYNVLRHVAEPMGVEARPDGDLPAEGTVLVYGGHEYRVGVSVDYYGIAHLPVGTTVWNGDDRELFFVKTDPDRNRWRRNNRGGVQMIASDFNQLRSIPMVEGAVEQVPVHPNGYTVGQAVSTADAETLPVGTEVNSNRPPRYWVKEREGDDGWRRDDRDRVQAVRWTQGQTIRSLPVQVPTTLAAFKARFCEAVTTLTAQYTEAHQATAARVLAELDAAHPSHVEPKVGTVATFGRPDRSGFTVFRFGRRGWVRIHGALDSAEGLALDFAADAEAAQDQAGMIEAYKAAAWAVGQQAKQDQGWCSAYDHLLVRFGITDPGPRPDFSPWPDLVKGEEARIALPVGAVLGVDKGDWGVFRKTAMPNEWERICGTRPLAAGTMRLLFSGEGEFRIHNAASLVPFLPADTVFRDRGGAVDVVDLP